MREFRFRAWHKEKKKMIEGSLEYWLKVCAETGINPFDACEWMQYTGLKDKNGKEIYEGDIVQSIDWGQSKRAKAIVIFEGYEWKTVPKNRGSHKTAYELWNQIRGKEGEFVEVIGNIYENKDLLK